GWTCLGAAGVGGVGPGGGRGDGFRAGGARRGAGSGAPGVPEPVGQWRGAGARVCESPHHDRLGAHRLGARLAAVVPRALRGAAVERPGATELRRLTAVAHPRLLDEVRAGDARWGP